MKRNTSNGFPMGGVSSVAVILLLVACLLPAGLATAQEEDEAVEEIVVTGIRRSLANAIEQKRDADNLIEVINAEDIGKLPDQNLAEVLENVTGIQITREAGVGTGVQIRGTNANRTEFNGVSTVGSGAGRSGIDFDDVSASIISSVEVVKAPEASTIEGSVGGTINLKTIRPLDLREQLAAIRIQGEDSSLQDGGGLSPRISGTWGNSWDTDAGEIGVVLSGSWNEQDVRAFRPRTDRDNLVGSLSRDANREDGDGNVIGPADSAQDFDFLPIQFLLQDYDNFDYETKNFAGSFEWAPNDDVKLYFDAIINDQERLQESSRAQASGVSNLAGTSIPDVFETVNFGAELGTIQAALRGVIPIETSDRGGADPNLRASTDTGSRVSESEIFRLGADWRRDRFSGRVELATSSNETRNPNFSVTLNFINPNVPTNDDNENGTPFIYDLSGGALTWDIARGEPGAPTDAQLLDPANYVLRDVSQARDTAENDEDAFLLDFTYDMDRWGIKTADLGYRYNKSASMNNDVRSNHGIRDLADAPAGDMFASVLSRIPGNFNDADGRSLFVDTLLLIDAGQANSNPAAVLAALNAAKAAHVAVTGGGRNPDPISEPTSTSTAFFDIEEKTHALYAQMNFEWGVVRGNAGLRYVQTDVTSSGISVLDGEETLTSSDGDYDFLLPRVNIVADVHDDLLVRASWSKDIRRPDFDNLSTSTTFETSADATVDIGNPALEPEEVESFDIGIEWYFTEGAVVSIGYFHKKRTGLFVSDINGAFHDPVTNERDDFDAPCEQGGIFNPIADRNQLNIAGVTGVGVCVDAETIINGAGDTTQKGVELAFQYDLSNWEDRLGWVSGFGFAANYTKQDFSGGNNFWTPTRRAPGVFSSLGNDDYSIRASLLDLSENAYNITVYYEKFGLSARARYTWREAYRSEDFGSTSSYPWGFPVVQEDRGQLNASVNYAVNDHLDIGIEAVNLTESEVEQSCVNEGALLCFQGLTDRRITFGASYRF